MNSRTKTKVNGRAAPKSGQAPKLVRTTFATSREMDFFSEKELVTQTGHECGDWPLVVVKELVDNALDACEEADVAPVIDVTADASGIAVSDNGPGLPEDALKGALDFTVRASSREAYVAPDRGRQGNALKTLLPMPLVIDPEGGKFVVEAHGKRHVLTCRADPISQRVLVHDDVTDLAKSKNPPGRNGTKKQGLSRGTSMRIEWTLRCDDDDYVLWPFDDLLPLLDYGVAPFRERFLRLVEGFAVFNPHATFRLDWFGEKTAWKATLPGWEKWKPCQPTSSHWYEPPHLERLIGAYVTHDRDAGKDRLVSDFIAEFDGLSGSAKRTKVLEAAGLKRAYLSELVLDGRLDGGRIGRLLAAMKAHSRPVKSERLGVLGEDHLRKRLLAMGVKAESFRYSRKIAKAEKVKTSDSASDEKASKLYAVGAGVGFRLSGPRRPRFPPHLRGRQLERRPGESVSQLRRDRTGSRNRSGRPAGDGKRARRVRAAPGASARRVHGPRQVGPGDWRRRMSITAADILDVTKKVTKEWTKQRKGEERGNRSRASREYVYSDRVDFTEVADAILPGGYDHASGGGKYTVSKRTFFYAVRDAFKLRTGRELQFNYFAGTLLVQFMNRRPDETAAWKVTADPRGALVIPNCAYDKRIPCGTIQIDNHLREECREDDPFDIDAGLDVEWPSAAHGRRYQAVLYIEKEGFEPLLQEARIAERFDLAILSCKGQSVVAARKFVDHVCRRDGGVPLFVAHDMDKAGFEIAQRLTTVSDWAEDYDRVTYRFQNEIDVTDLGLRLADARRYGLKGESCKFGGRFAPDSICTEEEKAYLRSGRRIELNEFTAPQFVQWLVSKLKQYLPQRLVPSDDVLEDAYRRALAVARINKAIEDVRDQAIEAARQAPIPPNLRRRLQKTMKENPWDVALYRLAAEEESEA